MRRQKKSKRNKKDQQGKKERIEPPGKTKTRSRM
jgi:hypothetical protein